MIYLDTLIDSIKQWDNAMGERKKTTLQDLLAVPLHSIGRDGMFDKGFRENPIYVLEERIQYLNKSQRIHEKFLVTGILSLISNYFSNRIKNRLDYIATNQLQIDSIESKSKGMSSPYLDDLKTAVEYFKSETYINTATEEKNSWEEIISKNFSEARILEMDNEFSSKQYNKYLEGLPEELLEEFERDFK